MAHLEAALFTRLTTHAGLAAIIGTRAYPVLLPQNPTLPAVVYQRISTRRPHAGGVDTGVAIPRFQVTGWATTALGAKDLKEQMRAALQRWRGTVAGILVMDTFLEGELDRYDDDAKLFGEQLDVFIPHREA